VPIEEPVMLILRDLGQRLQVRFAALAGELGADHCA
jgi:hypothetical protein